MSNTKKITFCAIMAAIAVVIMLTSYFPYLTYAIPAIASVFILIPTLELGLKWGTITYFVSAIIILLVGEMEAKLLFVIFLGYYPIVKETVERYLSTPLQYIIKFAVFNAERYSSGFSFLLRKVNSHSFSAADMSFCFEASS